MDKKIFLLQCFSDPFQIWLGFREEHVFKKAESRTEQSLLKGESRMKRGISEGCLRTGAAGHSQSVGSEGRRSPGATASNCHRDNGDNQNRTA